MVFLLAHNGKACVTESGLVADKKKPPKTSLIYTTDTWSRRIRDIKYKKHNANNNKRGYKVQNRKCKVRSTKYKEQNENNNCNCKYECHIFLYLSSTFLISFFFPSLTTIFFFQLNALQDVLSNIRMTTLLSDFQIMTQFGLS